MELVLKAKGKAFLDLGWPPKQLTVKYLLDKWKYNYMLSTWWQTRLILVREINSGATQVSFWLIFTFESRKERYVADHFSDEYVLRRSSQRRQ